MKLYHGKAQRSPRAQAVLENRAHARTLFNAIKAMKPGERIVQVAGVRFKTDARPLPPAAND